MSPTASQENPFNPEPSKPPVNTTLEGVLEVGHLATEGADVTDTAEAAQTTASRGVSQSLEVQPEFLPEDNPTQN